MPASTLSSPDWQWRWWLPVPLYPYSQRRTLCREVILDWVWVFEQIQGVLYVVTPIRMTVLRLETGGLMVYAPIAPTPECLRLLQDLVDRYGAVKHIILSTTSGIEHKVFVGPFARACPSAIVYVAPGQWSFPLNLPLSWLGLPTRRTKLLTAEHPWEDRFELAILDSIELGVGKFGEVALFDRRFQLLLVTDVVVAIPETPPAVVQLDPYPLLFHARTNASEAITDSPTQRLIGWQRIVLFTFYFRPSMVKIYQTGAMLQAAKMAPDRSARAFWGLYPFGWHSDWQKSFDRTADQGKLMVAPILQQLILSRQTHKTRVWVEQIAQWDFSQVISCHFQAPVTANCDDWRRAFEFLDDKSYLPEADLATLRDIDGLLSRFGVLPAIDSGKVIDIGR
jgi:Domain of unknown function (DUF4336)